MSQAPIIVAFRNCRRVTGVETGLREIFFAASNTQSFANQSVREAFFERWLGQYLRGDDADHARVAMCDGTVAGYVVGSHAAPALTPRFENFGYGPEFMAETLRYPAHLHVNLADAYRNRGIGAELVTAFADGVADAGLTGVHVITSAAARNVGFYQRNLFHERARQGMGPAEVVFLGRDCIRPGTADKGQHDTD